MNEHVKLYNVTRNDQDQDFKSLMTIHVLPIYKNSVFQDFFDAEGWHSLYVNISYP